MQYQPHSPPRQLLTALELTLARVLPSSLWQEESHVQQTPTDPCVAHAEASLSPVSPCSQVISSPHQCRVFYVCICQERESRKVPALL